MELIKAEIEVLQMVAGDIPWKNGAWVNACLDHLQRRGMIYFAYGYHITTRGISFLHHKVR